MTKITLSHLAAALLLALLGAACSNGDGKEEPKITKAFVYIAHNDDPGSFTDGDRVSAFSLDESSGELIEVDGSPFITDSGAGGLVIHPSGKFLYVNNYFGEHISCFFIDPVTGALTRGPYQVIPDEAGDLRLHPSGHFIYYSTRGGLTSYVVDPATGALTRPNHVGTEWPWGLAIDTSGRFIYIVYAVPLGLEAYAIDATSGALTPLPGSPYEYGVGLADVGLLPPGKILYAKVLNSNDVHVFSFDTATGALTPGATLPFTAPAGEWSVLSDPLGKFAYVLSGSDITVYKVDTRTGAWTRLGTYSGQAAGWGNVAFDPLGKFLFMTNHDAKTISTYAIDRLTGKLTFKAVHGLALNPESFGVVRIEQ